MKLPTLILLLCSDSFRGSEWGFLKSFIATKLLVKPAQKLKKKVFCYCPTEKKYKINLRKMGFRDNIQNLFTGETSRNTNSALIAGFLVSL